jgi:Kef-type K+ transport system membrane component KefB
LIELIITNLGLQHGVITPALFSVLVLMAIVTTLMTAPLFALANPRQGKLTSDRQSPLQPRGAAQSP